MLFATVPSVADDGPAIFAVSFEEGEAADLWSAKPQGGAQASIRIESGFGRGRSLRLEKSNVKGFIQWESAPISIETGTSYRVSTWLNTLPSDRTPLGGHTSAAAVYYMISLYNSQQVNAPRSNAFGPTRPFYSSNSQWENLDITFTTGLDINCVRVSLVIAQDTLDLLMDDVTLVRLGKPNAYKPRYEPPVAETLMPLEEAKKFLENRPRATAEVRRVGQRPRLFLDGNESFPEFYVGNAWRAMRSQVKEFGTAGVKVTFIPYILGRDVYGPFGVWTGPGQVDFSEVEEMLWRVLRADPHMYIMFYLCTDPYPEWATENNLEDVVTDPEGNKAIVDMHFLRWDTAPPKPRGANYSGYPERYGHSYVSQRLRNDTGEVLRQFAEYIRNSLPGKAVIGYHVIGGNDGQMFQWNDFAGSRCGDYSPASLNAFRDWLRARYSQDAQLQAAWCRPDVTLDTAEIPSAERNATDRLFLDRPEDTDLVDFRLFRSEGTIDTLAGYGQILRNTHQNPILLGTYYAGPTASVISHQATGYLLQKNRFNYVTSVLTYGAIRWPGGTGKAHQAWSSLLLHDIFGLSEADFRSWKTYPGTLESNYQVARVETEEASSAMIRRDTGHMLAVGQGMWWYDMSGGWFSDPSIMRTIKETVSGFHADLKNPALPKAEVAVFIDERSMSHVASINGATLHYAGINQQIVLLNASGVPYHLYLQEDVANARLPAYKLYVFLNPYHLSATEWMAIQGLRRDGQTLAFVHAPGIVAGSVPEAADAADAVTRITGIRVTGGGNQSLQLQTLTNNGIIETPVNQINVTAPVFVVDDPQAQFIATYTNGQCAVAFKACGNWKSLFFGGVAMNEFFFNALARHAGAWVAAPAGNAVYANQNFLTIHALFPGDKEVRLLERADVTDLATGELISHDTEQLIFPMQRGETRWFHLNTTWLDNAWPHCQKVAISGTLATTETLTNFPVLVQITDQANPVFRKAQTNAQDIIFTAADGVTCLAHEIDSFHAGLNETKVLNAWVRVPELQPGVATVLTMYYGNPWAADQQDRGAVWAEYAGVWHLEEDKAGVNTSLELYRDATTHAFHGKDYVSTNNAAGCIGQGAAMDGNDYIPFNRTLYTTNAFTITAWAKPDLLNSEAIVGDTSQSGRYFMLQTNTAMYGRSAYITNKCETSYGFSNLATGIWQHVAFRSTGQEGSLRLFYKNGAQLSPSPTPILRLPLAADPWSMIGTWANSKYFHGVLDEVRIADKALSPPWLDAEYRNAAAPAAYVSVGAEQGKVPWPATAFAYRQEIGITPDVTQAALTHFPMLIAITNPANHLFSVATANGSDILFTDIDGVTRLPHEIEQYHPASPSSLYAWVRLPVLLAATPTRIYMYYGRTGAINPLNRTNVWSEGYLGVWHLGEAVSNGQTNFDSTASAAHGVFTDPNSRGGGDVIGKIAGANAFVGGKGPYVLTPGVPCSSNGFTVSAWVYDANTITTAFAPFESGDRDASYSGINTSTQAIFSITMDGSQKYVNDTTVLSKQRWYHFALVCMPTQMEMYVDGVYKARKTYDHADARLRAKYIGRGNSTSWDCFFGTVDELRVSDTLRSAEWIKACYNTQQEPGAALAFMPPEYCAPSGTRINVQ